MRKGSPPWRGTTYKPCLLVSIRVYSSVAIRGNLWQMLHSKELAANQYGVTSRIFTLHSRAIGSRKKKKKKKKKRKVKRSHLFYLSWPVYNLPPPPLPIASPLHNQHDLQAAEALFRALSYPGRRLGLGSSCGKRFKSRVASCTSLLVRGCEIQTAQTAWRISCRVAFLQPQPFLPLLASHFYFQPLRLTDKCKNKRNIEAY